MAKAQYFNENKVPKDFDVLKDHGDGTVDIGVGTKLVVGKVKVTTEPTIGCVVLLTDAEADKAAADKAAADKAAADKAAADKAAADKAAADKAAEKQDKPASEKATKTK